MLTLSTEPRDINLSKGELNRLRKEGKIPACLYGQGMKNEDFFINKVEFEKVFNKEGKIFETEVAGKKHLTNAKEIQLSSVSHDLVHISFVKLKKGEKTTVLIPVQTIGQAAGEKNGGNVMITFEKIKVDGVPSKMPSHIEIDLTNLEIDQSIHLGDIKLPEGITLNEAEDPEQDVVSCTRPSTSEPESEDQANTEETPVASSNESSSEQDKPAE